MESAETPFFCFVKSRCLVCTLEMPDRHVRATTSVRLSPTKNNANVPGPVCEPMTVPMLLIITLPLKCGNAASIISP